MNFMNKLSKSLKDMRILGYQQTEILKLIKKIFFDDTDDLPF